MGGEEEEGIERNSCYSDYGLRNIYMHDVEGLFAMGSSVLTNNKQTLCESSTSNYCPLIPPQQASNIEGVASTNLHQKEDRENSKVNSSELVPEQKPCKVESLPSGIQQILQRDNVHNSNSSNMPLIRDQNPQREHSENSNSDNSQLTFTQQVALASTADQATQLEHCENTKSNNSGLVPVQQPCNTESLAVSCIGKGSEKKALYKSGQRSSNYRGVTKHRWTGKFEAHLWDNTVLHEGRKRKGKQGGYDSEQKAAQAYDLAALKYWGPGASTKLNFPISEYEKELEEMKNMSQDEYVNSIRRKSICFTRGQSKYRGVTRLLLFHFLINELLLLSYCTSVGNNDTDTGVGVGHGQHEGRRWQARIGRVAGGKDIYLGTYDTQEEAAEAYDIAAVKLRGMNAITNFDISNYYKEGTKELDVIPINCVGEGSSAMRIRYFKLT
ncbi:hypothetical protein GIB67_000541 [Kingdonia uniflora]|uniref:AP2/ERF domain-containing protein n=1 Tax=Kingdonia uniflora TaxID=39325 RepID=A0A7J7MIG5_9MAGN|nr:hypothetical protein GIB67_000541 [Kingdonia uniflora]